MTCHWLELDDNDIILVIDLGDGFDLETVIVRADYDVPPDLRDEWHELDAERREVRAFGAACVAEAVGCWEGTRGV